MVDAGTLQIFYQTAAPTGWTKSTTHNNKALRLVTGTASSGGTNSFTATFTNRNVDNFSLTSAETPLHSHDFIFTGETSGLSSANKAAGARNSDSFNNENISNSGSSSAHNHGVDFSVRYVDVIIASKD